MENYPFLGFSVLQDNPGGDIEFLGSGIGIGLGSDFFISDQLAINLGYTIGAITIDEVSIGNFTENVEESASSGRLNLGWYTISDLIHYTSYITL